MSSYYVLKGIHLLGLFFLLGSWSCSGTSASMTRNEIEIRLNKDEGFALYRDGHLLLSSFRGDFSVESQDRKGKAYGPFSGTKVSNRDVEEIYGAFRFQDEVGEYSELLVKKVKEKKESLQFEFDF